MALNLDKAGNPPAWSVERVYGAKGTLLLVGVGLGYSAHAQATLRVAEPHRFGQATASLQLCDNLGVALGAGLSGAIVAFGDSAGWSPGSSVGAALVGPIAVAVLGGAVVARRLPPKASA